MAYLFDTRVSLQEKRLFKRVTGSHDITRSLFIFAAVLHDIGKFTPSFQYRILKDTGLCLTPEYDCHLKSHSSDTRHDELGMLIILKMNYMNGQKGVSEKKRAQIMRLASKMNYIPNAAARALSHNMSDTIGVIISADTEYTLQNLYWLEFIVAVSEEAERHNCNLLIIAQGKDNFKPLENAVRKRAVDGLVIPAELAYPDAIQFIKESKMPFVLQGQSSLFGHYCVDVRNKEGAEILTSRLVESGYKKIACIAGPDELCFSSSDCSS